MASIYYQSASELTAAIRKKDLSPAELMEETLRRIEAMNPTLNAFVSLRADEAMDEARAMTDAFALGKQIGPLAGIPIGVKDLEDVKGMVTSYGSVPFKNNVAPVDSTQVARLKTAGAIVVGKTNTPEFGFTGFTKNLLFGVTKNPWNTDRTPGGSSGGSGAAVSGGMVPLATGSDGGGSIRIPASYSGCFGLKTSFGRVPRGPFPLLPSTTLSCLGPLARTVEDAALYLDCVAGYHPSDPESLPWPDVPFLKKLNNMPAHLRIAFSPDFGYARVEKTVMTVIEQALHCFRDMGHTVELWQGALPDVSQTWSNLFNLDIYCMLHERFEDNRREMGKTLVKALDQVKSFSVKEYLEAQKSRTDLNQIMGNIFEQVDLLITPTMPSEPFAAKGPPPAEIDGHPIPLLGTVAFTYPFNLSGHPAASVRAGLTGNGLPVGLQIVGPRHRDDLVLQASYAYEQARPWNDDWPDAETKE